MTAINLKVLDGIEGMCGLVPESVDVIVTSPPYNLGIKYKKYDDAIEHGSYMRWTGNWLRAAKRALKPGGSLFLNLGACPRKPLLPYQVVTGSTAYFILQNVFHWIKAVSLEMKDGSTLSVGHFKPINSKRFVNDCHEFVFHFTKSGTVPIDRLALGVPYMDKSNVKRWAHTSGRDKRCRGNVWFIPYETIQNRNKQRPHPATFPPKLAEYAIKVHGGNDLTVVDPFLGIGSSCIGARDSGIVSTFFGFDIDSEYIDEASQRLSQIKEKRE